jgi:hypothetical protein
MEFTGAISKIPASALWLGVAGLIPFWLPLLAISGLVPAPDPGTALLVQIGYGAVILSFLGGIRWGAALKLPRGPVQSTLFVFSVLPALAGYLALLLPAMAGLVLLIAAFLSQGLWDVQSAQNRRLPPWFATLRALLTVGAVTALLLATVARFVQN